MKTKKTIEILELADVVISYQNVTGNSINHLKLQKLLYYIQSWNFVFNDVNLYQNDDLPEAWVNGPVYRTVYTEYKENPLYQDLISRQTPDLENPTKVIENLNLTKKTKDVIYSVLKKYGSFSGDYLVVLTHNEDPWLEARKGLDVLDASKEKIKLETMKKFYTDMFDKSKKKDDKQS